MLSVMTHYYFQETGDLSNVAIAVDTTQTDRNLHIWLRTV